MVNYYIAALIVLFIVPFVAAESPYIVGQPANIVYAVRLNGGVLDTTQCNISVTSPQKDIIITSFTPMTYSTSTKLHNYTIPAANITTDGDYCYSITCSGSGYNSTGTDCIEVTPSGKTVTTPQSILYIFLFAMTASLFVLAIFGGSTIKGGNKRNEYNELIAINWWKYLKTACWFGAFYLMYFMLNLTQNIAFGFLNIPFAGRFYTMIIQFVNVAVYVSIPLTAGFFIYMFVADMKIRKQILGGIYRE